MCLDVVFGSCCLPGMAVDAHITHEVNFLFLCKGKMMVVIILTFLLFILCTMVAAYVNRCETEFKVSCCRDLRFASITVPTSSALEMLEK